MAKDKKKVNASEDKKETFLEGLQSRIKKS